MLDKCKAMRRAFPEAEIRRGVGISNDFEDGARHGDGKTARVGVGETSHDVRGPRRRSVGRR